VTRFKINIFCLLLLGTLLSTSVLAQEKDERPAKKQPPVKKPKKETVQPRAPADSSAKSPFAEPETLKTMPVNSKLYWYDLGNTLHPINDSSDYEVYRYSTQKSIIFTDLGSIFQYQPLWFVYDLQEMNRPTYVAMLNKYPHQNSIFYNTVLMNDPVHGMYNLQYLSVDFTRFIEAGTASQNLQNFMYTADEKIAVTSAHRHTPAAWTKILYKQGNFGYTDLDISFVKPVSKNVALQLGGFSRQYDGSIINGDHRGYNFRGELTWQYSPRLYFSTQFYLGRERSGMTSYDINLDFPYPRFAEDRDDYFFDLTWLPRDSTNQRLHLVLYNGYTYRRVKDYYNRGYQIKTHINRYGLDANYNFCIKQMNFLVGAGTLLPRVSGTAFKKNYFPSTFNTYGMLKLPLKKKLDLEAAAQIATANGFNPRLQPFFSLSFKPDSNQNMGLEFAQSVRFPTLDERYFNFDTLFGNPHLQPEEHRSASLKYSLRLAARWKIQLTGGACWIRNEIGWREPNFYNAGSRDFYYLALRNDYSFWKIDLQTGGQYTLADLYLTSRSSIWLSGHFFQKLLKGALLLDAYGTVLYFDRHRNINFDQRLDRFYLTDGYEQGYYVLNWRVVATVKEAEIFAEAENALSGEYEVINGYREFFIRFRFGVNWILWD
jgi:outer membrane cobalamin receptor